jgi:hypothetical protein
MSTAKFCIAIIFTLTLSACHKQLAGPRKITAIGHIEWSEGTNLITQVYYDKSDERAITMKLHHNYKISGDVSGTWAPNGAQILLYIVGEFGPASPFPIDLAYYETKPTLLIQGHTIQMSDFTSDMYFIVITKGQIGTVNYERHFVFK